MCVLGTPTGVDALIQPGNALRQRVSAAGREDLSVSSKSMQALWFADRWTVADWPAS